MVHQSPTKKNDFNLVKSTVSDRFIITCFSGSIIKNGKKQKASRFFFFLLYSIRRLYNVDPISFIRILLDQTRPKVFLSSKKVAGIVHKIPTPITSKKSYSIVIHWIVSAAKKRSATKNFSQSLLDEITDIYRNPSNSTVKKRDEFHKTAYVNKPFLRFYKF